MKPSIRLEICAFFADEFRAALEAEERDDVELAPIHGACDERRHPAPPSVQSEIQTLRLMGVCSGGTVSPKTLHSCFELLLGPDKVEALLNAGAHLLTPAMVRAYPETLHSLNEKPENLHAYFAESVHAWVVVDTGTASLTAAEQAAFLSATGGKMELLPAELHLLRANLRATLAQGEAAAINTRSSEQIASLQHRLADYTMAYDLISRLIPYQGEQTIIDAILELFYMLCAPRAVHLLLIQDEDSAEGSVQLFSLPANSGKENHLHTFLHCPNSQGETEVPRGFYFQIHQEDAKTLGAVVIEGAFLPEHQRNYLDIAYLLMPILRLALHNARSYEKLCNTERELRASQTELEQRVVERTTQLTAEIAVRKQREQALREAEARFRSSFEAAAIGMALVSIEGRFVDANSALCELVGYSYEELLQKTFQEITHPDDLDVDLIYARQLIAGERTSYQMEKRYFHKDGHIVWILLTGSTVRDTQGNLLYFIAQIQDITERKQATDALHASESRYRTLVENSPFCIHEIDLEGRLQSMNKAGLCMLGLDDEKRICGVPYLNAVNEQDSGRIRALLQGALSGTASHFEFLAAGDASQHFKSCFIPIKDASGKVVSLMGLTEDITERKQAEEKLLASKQKFKQLFMLVPIPLGVVNKNGVIVYFNDWFTKVFGYTTEEVPTLKEWWQLAYPDESYRQWAINSWGAAVAKAAKQGTDIEPSEYRLTCKNGTERIVLIGGAAIEDNVLATFVDITERKQAEEQIRNLASHDTLTQLPNRRMLNDRLEQAIAASKRSGRYGAVMFLDLDNFKPLNDRHGHDVGDLLLIEVARRLCACVREIDTVARFGGDEFVVMLSELDVDKDKSTAEARVVAEKIRVILAEPYLLTLIQQDNTETVEHHCTSSIGVVLFINQETSPEDILKCADKAMYQAKECGRNLIRFYDSKT